MAETLASGTALIDTLGALAIDVATHWQPDELFFELARDREAVGAMLAEVIGETAARSYLTDTGTKKKALIRKALAGDGRTKVDGWLPRYMRFPQGGYTPTAPLLARERAVSAAMSSRNGGKRCRRQVRCSFGRKEGKADRQIAQPGTAASRRLPATARVVIFALDNIHLRHARLRLSCCRDMPIS